MWRVPLLHDALKDFQSGIVGLLGFSGVIITLWWNARLARNAREQQISQARSTIRTAMREELECVQEELVNIDKGLRRKSAGPAQFTLEEPYVYRALVKDIGVLEPEQAQAVIRVHRDLYLLLRSIREVADDPDKPIAQINREGFPEAARYVSAALHETDIAVKALADDHVR